MNPGQVGVPGSAVQSVRKHSEGTPHPGLHFRRDQPSPVQTGTFDLRELLLGSKPLETTHPGS